MCTLTWLVEENAYSIFFNRDEQRSRPQAIAPAYLPNYDAIMPIDPMGGGTWIAAHRSGLTLCLLNYYEYQIVPAARELFLSRGKIIPNLLATQDPQQAVSDMQGSDLTCYQAFRLCVFPPVFNGVESNALMLVWNGKALRRETPAQPVISSALSTDKVRKSRSLLFRDTLSQAKKTREMHLAYHASHQPRKNGLSVCMHRQDAKTQSLSAVYIGKDVRFSYQPGSPCNGGPWLDSGFPGVSTTDSCQKTG